jgi:hypothetical protein
MEPHGIPEYMGKLEGRFHRMQKSENLTTNVLRSKNNNALQEKDERDFTKIKRNRVTVLSGVNRCFNRIKGK